LGTGRARSFLYLMNAVGAACGRAPKIEFIEMPSEIRHNYQYFTAANIGKLRAAGYHAAFTPLEQAVSDYVAEYLVKDPYL
jgi:ADP-L-glycero-D-manno-heptose 6-epimerase